MGARVIALDVSPERLARAKEFGAWETVNPRSNDPVGAIKDLTHGGQISRSTLRASRKAASPRCAAPRCGAGVLCRRAQQCDDRRQPRHAAQAADDHRLVDLLVAGPGRLRALCRRAQGRIEKLLTHRWNLDQAKEAYRLFDTQTTGKGVFLMWRRCRQTRATAQKGLGLGVAEAASAVDRIEQTFELLPDNPRI
jgi:threonine dehydrogenase-like Zn-dependent dehydrogenase